MFSLVFQGTGCSDTELVCFWFFRNGVFSSNARSTWWLAIVSYGVATMGRLLKITGLFGRI